MFAVQMSTRTMFKPIVTFDGQVLEVFIDDLGSSGRRVHVGHMRSVALTQVSHGKEPYMLTVKGEYLLLAIEVSEAALGAAQQLAAALQAAMTPGQPQS
jgi:predicted RecA/RadA family phage recombinase